MTTALTHAWAHFRAGAHAACIAACGRMAREAVPADPEACAADSRGEMCGRLRAAATLQALREHAARFDAPDAPAPSAEDARFALALAARLAAADGDDSGGA